MKQLPHSLRSRLSIVPVGNKGSLFRRLDYCVDGEPLKTVLRVHPNWHVCALGWNAESDRETVQTLLLERRSDLESGRVPIYGCKECGDVNCGVVSARIAIKGNIVRWSEFGREAYDYDADEWRVKLHAAWAPAFIEFDLAQYRAALEQYLASRFS